MTDYGHDREGARQDGGKFGAQPLASSGAIDLGGSEPNPGLAVSYETLEWHQPHGRVLSRKEQALVRSAYQAAVPAELGQRHLVFDLAVLAEAEDAVREITAFDRELSAKFGDAEFAPLGSVLLRTESASSSDVENITVRAKALALAELGIVKFGSNAGLVAQNVDAMKRAMALAEEVTPQAILDVHEALMRGDGDATPGNFRDDHVQIGGGNTPFDATFIPPHHSRVVSAIQDMCDFARRPDVPLLAQAAVAHAQFETIHPFFDGNGRTGRTLVHTMLRKGGATTRTTVPVSAGLLSNTSTYFAALTAYRNGDPNPIVRRFSEASYAAINNGRQLAGDLEAIHEDWRSRLNGVRSDAVVWRALPQLLSHPAVTSRTLSEFSGVSQPAADNAIRQLKEAGIVRPAPGIQRGIVWITDDVLTALDDFGERARRQAP